jgi:hypothetical protein
MTPHRLVPHGIRRTARRLTLRMAMIPFMGPIFLLCLLPLTVMAAEQKARRDAEVGGFTLAVVTLVLSLALWGLLFVSSLLDAMLNLRTRRWLRQLRQTWPPPRGRR